MLQPGRWDRLPIVSRADGRDTLSMQASVEEGSGLGRLLGKRRDSASVCQISTSCPVTPGPMLRACRLVFQSECWAGWHTVFADGLMESPAT